MEMPNPEGAEETGGHITGLGMCEYIETFYSKFLEGKATFKFETEILNVKRIEKGSWEVEVQDLPTGGVKVIHFARIILCTGVRGSPSSSQASSLTVSQGCSNPQIPPSLNSAAAEQVGFKGIVIHSSQFRLKYEDILAAVQPKESGKPGTILVVGGGKSAMESVVLVIIRIRSLF